MTDGEKSETNKKKLKQAQVKQNKSFFWGLGVIHLISLDWKYYLSCRVVLEILVGVLNLS